MGKEQLDNKDTLNNNRYHPYSDNRKKEKKEDLEEEDDIYFFGTWFIPKHMIFSILQFLDLKCLVAKGLLINKKFYKVICDDCDGILWDSLCLHASWLKPLYHDLKKSLQTRRHKWMRFISIFTDNFNQWDCRPNYAPNLDSDFKFFSNYIIAALETFSQQTEENNTLQTVKYLGNPKNTSCSSTFLITSNTVKCFHVRLDNKSDKTNVGIGMAEKSFLLLERKFVGFNPYNVGCSSNGKARCYFPNVQDKHSEVHCNTFNTGDVISIVVDMLGSTVSFYINGVFSYEFQNVQSKGISDPYRITATMFSAGDQFSFVHDTSLTIPTLLDIYDNCEKSYDTYHTTLYNLKNQFKEVAEHFVNDCNDVSQLLASIQTMKKFIDKEGK